MDLLNRYAIVRQRAAEWLGELDQIVHQHVELAFCTMEEMEREVRLQPKGVESLWLDIGIPGEHLDRSLQGKVYFTLGLAVKQDVGLFLQTDYSPLHEEHAERFAVKAELDPPGKPADLPTHAKYAIETYRVHLNAGEKAVSRMEAVEHAVRIAKIFQALAVQLRGGRAIIEGGI